MKDSFSKLHPVLNLVFFSFVISLSMFIMNPVCLGLSLICSFVNAVYLNGIKTVKLCLKFVLPMAVLIAVINPVFNHQGVTILSYFPWGNPLTLESIIYGIASGALLSCVVLWFSVLNSVMTSDKLIFLFGRIIPSMSLVVSMSLRFVPRFTAQFKNIRNAQRCIGRDICDGSIPVRTKNLITIISIMISWSMENAIETADSMKSRGFGLKGRTAYSIYRFDGRDLVLLILTSAAGAFVWAMLLCGAIDFNYFPITGGNLTSPEAIFTFVIYAVLMLTPTAVNVKEGLKWKRLRSAI